jgi:predicted DNA-binding transcriptional regulator AlpA
MMASKTQAVTTEQFERPLLLSDYAAAEWLGISRATLWRRVQVGELPRPIRLGGRTLWRRDELMEAVERATRDRDGRYPRGA